MCANLRARVRRRSWHAGSSRPADTADNRPHNGLCCARSTEPSLMPRRSLILAIIAFWLGTTLWLFQREILPRLDHDSPPLFTYGDNDDKRSLPVPIRWAVTHSSGHPDNKPLLYTASTSVVHHDRNREDVYEFLCTLLPRTSTAEANTVFDFGQLETSYLVGRDYRMT